MIQTSGSFFNFSNIWYAEPPLGDLRFRAPVPVRGKSNVVNDGSIGKICPQANPAWNPIADEFIPAYLSGQPFKLTAVEAAIAQASDSLPVQDARTTEDCLFLDVVVPEKIFSRVTKTANANDGAPVLVWIYGGGYTAGEKTGFGQYNPAGLIEASQTSGSDGIVFVSFNYRLGAFGWLAGPTLQSDGTANAALYDQKLALEWIQENIHLFGGDPHRVTVIGESAGRCSAVAYSYFAHMSRRRLHYASNHSFWWSTRLSALSAGCATKPRIVWPIPFNNSLYEYCQTLITRILVSLCPALINRKRSLTPF